MFLKMKLTKNTAFKDTAARFIMCTLKANILSLETFDLRLSFIFNLRNISTGQKNF